jgi:hypothetical protein
VTPPNRSDARKALAQLLGDGVSAAGVVFDHQADDFGGKSPAICVTSAASERQRLTIGDTRGRATFGLALHTFVVYRDKAAGWTPAQAEDRLDLLEQQIFAVMLANPRTASWKTIAYGDPTEARDIVTIGGVVYLHEVIPVAASVF